MSIFLQLLDWAVTVFEAVTLRGLYLFASCLVALLCCAVFAPVGALRWWAGLARKPRGIGAQDGSVELEPQAVSNAAPSSCVVYLSGIGDISGQYTKPMEQMFLDRLAAELPGAILVDDVFAFSVTNLGMTDEHMLGKFWLWLHTNEINRTRLAVLGQLINLRNMLQVAVSVDRRYGSIYGWGTASTIIRSLLKHGYPYGCGMPITLIGYSGGGQISLGSARYLQATLRAPLQLISLGGVMDSDPGIDALERITHLYGAKDGVQRIGDMIFPERWAARPRSRWNLGLKSGKIRRVELGPMKHNGASSYFDDECRLPNGDSFLDHTVQQTVGLIREFGAQAPAAGSHGRMAGGEADD